MKISDSDRNYFNEKTHPKFFKAVYLRRYALRLTAPKALFRRRALRPRLARSAFATTVLLFCLKTVCNRSFQILQ